MTKILIGSAKSDFLKIYSQVFHTMYPLLLQIFVVEIYIIFSPKNMFALIASDHQANPPACGACFTMEKKKYKAGGRGGCVMERADLRTFLCTLS